MGVLNSIDRTFFAQPLKQWMAVVPFEVRVVQVALVALISSYVFFLVCQRAAPYLTERLVVYGCEHQHPRMVHLFTRSLTGQQVKKIAWDFVYQVNSRALEYFIKNGVCHYPSLMQVSYFDPVTHMLVGQGEYECFVKLLESHLISPDCRMNDVLLERVINKQNLTLACDYLQRLAGVSKKSSSDFLENKVMNRVLDLSEQLSDEEAKQIIPFFFEFLGRSDYYSNYSRPGINDKRDKIYQIFKRGIRLKVVDINVPFDAGGNRYLHLVVRDQEAAKQALADGADPNIPRADGTTPFHLAVENSTIPVIKQFIELGAEIGRRDGRERTPLQIGLDKQRLDVVFTLLIIREQRKEEFPYCTDKEFKSFIVLLGNNLSTLENNQIEFVDTVIVRALEEGLFPIHSLSRFLHWAIEGNRSHFAKGLIAQGADIETKNEQGVTILERCIQLGQTPMAIMLLKRGAAIPKDPALALQAIKLIAPQIIILENMEIFLLGLFAFWEQIAYQGLAREDRQAVLVDMHRLVFSDAGIKILKQRGWFNRSLTRDGLTPLHLAVLGGNVFLFNSVLANGGDITARSGSAQLSMLHLALPNKDMLGYLLSNFPQLLTLRDGEQNLTAFEVVCRTAPQLMPFFVEKCKPEDLLSTLHQAMEQVAEPPRNSVYINIEAPDGTVHRVPYVIPNEPAAEFLRMAQFRLLRENLVVLLEKHKTFQENLKRICQEFDRFKSDQKITREFICELAKHHPFTLYLRRIPYAELFGAPTKELLKVGLQNEDFQICFLSLEPHYLSALSAGSMSKGEALQLKDAALTVGTMCKLVSSNGAAGETNSPFHPMAQRIGIAIQHVSSTAAVQKRDFKGEFDEQDGMVLVGRIFSEIQMGAQVTAYCQRAVKIGLLEGRDFRAAGIDDNLADLYSLMQSSGDEKPALEQELTREIQRKKTLLLKWKKKGFLKDIAAPDEPLHQELASWEVGFNHALLTLIFSKESQLAALLKTRNAQALSELQDFDLLEKT